MVNRLKGKIIYFDQFNADATLAKVGAHFIVKKIRMLSATKGDDFKLENEKDEVIFHMSNNTNNADVNEVDFGEQGFDFGNQGVRIDVSECTGMAATNGTDAVWIYLL